MIFETHAHYDDEAFDEDRDVLLNSMQENGIGAIIDACADLRSLSDVEKLMERYAFVYGAAGIHPDYAGEMTEDTLEQIKNLAKHPKVLAIGEIGLDYYWHKEEEEHLLQQKMFRAQLDIAREMKLPFMVHSREACSDTLEIIREYMAGGMFGGVIHCFSYSRETARQYLDMGLYLGIGGVVTFKNARKLKEVVMEAPLERLLLETDCPYLAPVPYRGKRNCSLYLPYVAREIAALKGVTEEEVIEVTRRNAEELFHVKIG